LNSNGYYKLISLLATLPASLVNQERGTVEAMLSSYRVPPVVVQNYLLAFYPAGAATTAQGAPGSAQLQSNPTVNAEMSAAYLGAVEHQIATKQRAMSFGVSCQDKVINGNYLGFDLQGC
jgi:hypothetical protein